MRVLVLEDEELGIKEVMEIIDIGYNNDIFDDGGSTFGLYFIDIDGYYFYIPDVPFNRNMLDILFKGIMLDGYHDLSIFGEYQVLEFD